MLQKIKENYILIIIVILVAMIFTVPSLAEQIKMNHFGKPLHHHALPEDTVVLHKGTQYQNLSEEKIAVMLLKTPLNIEETKAFFADILETEAAAKYNLTLDVEEMSEKDLGAVKEGGYYDENMNYLFVYIYSTEKTEK